MVVHIDPLGSADPIPFGMGAPPFARIRVQPLAGGLCRYSVSSNDPDDEHEEDIVQTERIPTRIIQTSELLLHFKVITTTHGIVSSSVWTFRVQDGKELFAFNSHTSFSRR